jgi:hypothetical protein
MLSSVDDLLSVARRVFSPESIPRAFLILEAAQRVQGGAEPASVAASVKTSAKKLRDVAAAADPTLAALGVALADGQAPPFQTKARATLGQLLLGQLAERTFEGIYKSRMGTDELRLEDDRESRSDTDYRVINGQGRQVFRINIKFHGSQFKNARDMVGLEPSDCFALATYKIHQALLKQDKEVRPYIFVIVGVPDLTGVVAGQAIPDDLADLAAVVLASKMPGKRDVEDAIVRHLVEAPQPQATSAAIDKFRGQIEAAEWRVLSARKADKLLRTMLFDRVFAVRVRGFARHYRNAELDMHFSLSQDLTPVGDFLDVLKSQGVPGLTGHLERGLI